MVSILCDGLQHRSVLLLPRPILGTSSHATDFIISGKHVASLFDYVPVNDTAYVYGSLRLEEKGLVYRTVSATDGRCRILALTEEGQRFHDDFQTVLHQVNERLERGFTQEEKAQFTAFLLRAGRNLTDEEEEA